MRRYAIPLTLILFCTLTPNVLHAASNARTLKAYGNLPLSFVENQGQMNAQVRYVITGPRASAFFRDDGVTFDLWDGQRPMDGRESVAENGEMRHSSRFVPVPEDTSTNAVSRKHSVLKLSFVGADPGCEAEGTDELPGKVNYLVGKDQSKWHTDIPTFKGVIYKSVWPGIDVAYRGDRQQLKYDVVAAPDSDLNDIRLKYEGAEKIWLDKAGDLYVKTTATTFVERVPGIFQEKDGQKLHLRGGYTLEDGNTVGFHVEGRDLSLALTIDPANNLVYSTYLGGSGTDAVGAIAVDSSGCAYIAGWTSSNNFPTTTGAFQTTPKDANGNAFVTKLNSTGASLIYSTFLGGSGGGDAAYAIAVDSSDCAYVAGQTLSTDFPTTLGAFQTSLNGKSNAFVTKVNASGSALLYSTFLGGSSYDLASSIAVDSSDCAYVAGVTLSSNFPTTTGAFQTSHKNANGVNAFVTKLDSDGSSLLYSTYLGGSGNGNGGGDSATAIRVDSGECAYVAGVTRSSDFPTTTGAFQTSLKSTSGNAFVTKLNSTGSSLVYSTFLGGSSGSPNGGDVANAIAINSSGFAYVVGQTYSSDFPTTTGAFQTTNNTTTYGNAFVTKLNPVGSTLVYSTFLGGSGSSSTYGGDAANAIAIDSSGFAYIAGGTHSTDFPTTPSALQSSLKGPENAFVTKLNPVGSYPAYSSFLGGSGKYGDAACAIAVDSAGHSYVLGQTSSTDFPTTSGAFQTSLNGPQNAFVSKLNMGVSVLAGLASNGSIWYTTDMNTWNNVSGTLSSVVLGDFRGDGTYGIAGLASNNSIWYTTDMNTWTNIQGELTSLVVGDFTGTGKDGIAGLAQGGSIWYTTDLQSWTNVRGSLKILTAGNFAGNGDWGLAGIANGNSLWLSADFLTWSNIPGQLASVVPGCFNGSGKYGLAGITSNGSIWYTNDLVNWNNIPGQLSSLVVGDFNGSGNDGIAGLGNDGSVWYTTNLSSWSNISGTLESLVVGDFKGGDHDGLAGLASDGSIWYTTDLQTWTNIPGKLSSLAAYP
jgi:hypothetical protein